MKAHPPDMGYTKNPAALQVDPERPKAKGTHLELKSTPKSEGLDQKVKIVHQGIIAKDANGSPRIFTQYDALK